MTHDEYSTRFEEVIQVLCEHGFDGMAEAIEILMNEEMKLERADALGAMPYQRSESRRGYANGFKPKTVRSRLGRLNLQVPQTRDVDFYSSALERGERSERALKLAVAEVYVQGVSTRKVAEITKELCGLDVSSSQVSRAASYWTKSSKRGAAVRLATRPMSSSTRDTKKCDTAEASEIVPC